jgi:hydrogenase/urease accessory protein HupE
MPMTRLRGWRFWCGLLVAALTSSGVRAHDARPVSIDVTEQSTGLYLVHLRVPPSVEIDNQPSIAWPNSCLVRNRELRDDPPAPNETSLIQCSAGLDGQRVGLTYPIFNPSLSTLFRLHGIGRRPVTQVLAPDQRDWLVPREPTWYEVATGYLKLGIEHIWTGIDHLLFVSGLLILARTRRRVVLAITGFTLAHSLTLSASVLGLARLPVAPVEAAIALSILFLAREIARPDPYGLARRFPIAVSCSFGLLHGFGFAAALREVGLPTGELALGLLCFNLGVEIGQLLFIAGALAAVLIIRRAVPATAWLAEPRRASLLAGYALGIPAAFWLIERMRVF